MSQSCKATVGVVRSRWFDSRYIYRGEEKSLVIILIIAFRALECIGRVNESCVTAVALSSLGTSSSSFEM